MNINKSNVSVKNKVKNKVPIHTKKAYEGCGGTAPLIVTLTLGGLSG
jgi:hypothetical protein